MSNLLQVLMEQTVVIPQTPGVRIRRSDLYAALKTAGFGPKSLDLFAFAPRSVSGIPAPYAKAMAESFVAFLLEENPEYAG